MNTTHRSGTTQKTSQRVSPTINSMKTPRNPTMTQILDTQTVLSQTKKRNYPQQPLCLCIPKTKSSCRIATRPEAQSLPTQNQKTKWWTRKPQAIIRTQLIKKTWGLTISRVPPRSKRSKLKETCWKWALMEWWIKIPGPPRATHVQES